MPGLVAEVHVLKAHIPPQGRQGAVRLLPGPAARLFRAGGQAAAALLHVDQDGSALVHLAVLVHDLEDPLRAGQGGQQEVGLLGELVDGHGGLAHKDQIAGQAAHVGGAVDGHDAAQHRHNGVVEIGDGDHRGHHGGRIALGPGARPAQGLVFLPELLQAGPLVVEHLHHLLAGHHLLNVAVQLTQGDLLPGVVFLAPLPAEADVAEHDHIAGRHHQGQPPVEDKQDGQGAHHLNEGLDHHGEAVVQRVGNGVHVVGEVAHHVAVAVGVEELEGQGLEVGEEIPPDVPQDLLGGPHHDLGVAVGGQDPQGVDARRHRHAGHQVGKGPGGQGVDHRPDHIGPQQIGQGADGDQHRHRQQQELVPPQIGQEGAQGVPQVFRLFRTELPGRHGHPLLSSETRRSPGRSGRRPAGSRGCPRRGPARPPG